MRIRADGVRLRITVAGSAFMAEFDGLGEWRSLLDCADSISIITGGREAARVDLDAEHRWIAFADSANGQPVYCVGYQETVGAIRQGHTTTGGSNRKVLAWLMPDGVVRVTNGNLC